MIPAVGIVSIPLDLFRRNRNVLSVFPAPCVDVAVDVFDFGRIAVGFIATTGGGMIRHMPRRIKFLVQGHILRWMVPRRVILCVLRLGGHRQCAAKNAAQEEFA